MTILGRPSQMVGLLLGVLLVGCGSDSSSCPPGNGRMCDIFSLPLNLAHEQYGLHFTSMQVVEGSCKTPRCYSSQCATLVFDDLYSQLEVTGSAAGDLPPGTVCRYAISSSEGQSFDVVFSLLSSSSTGFCCNTGLRKFVGYKWTASANGVEMRLGGGGGLGPVYFLPSSSVDGG